MRDDVERLGESHDRVADELPRTVPGDLPAAVDIDDGRAVGRSLMARGAGAGGVHRLVLEQDERVGARACDDLGMDAALQRPAILIGDEFRVETRCDDLEHGAPWLTRLSGSRPTIRIIDDAPGG